MQGPGKSCWVDYSAAARMLQLTCCRSGSTQGRRPGLTRMASLSSLLPLSRYKVFVVQWPSTAFGQRVARGIPPCSVGVQGENQIAIKHPVVLRAPLGEGTCNGQDSLCNVIFLRVGGCTTNIWRFAHHSPWRQTGNVCKRMCHDERLRHADASKSHCCCLQQLRLTEALSRRAA